MSRPINGILCFNSQVNPQNQENVQIMKKVYIESWTRAWLPEASRLISINNGQLLAHATEFQKQNFKHTTIIAEMHVRRLLNISEQSDYLCPLLG